MREKIIEEKNKKRLQKISNNKGITLIALVVTIVVLLILAGISINLVLGPNGLIAKAQEAVEETDKASKNELVGLNNISNEVDKLLGNTIDNEEDNNDEDDNEDITPPPPQEPYVDEELVVPPELASGMIPVKWDGINWIKTDIYDSSWYNYAEQKWANVVLVGTDGLDADGDQQVFNEDGTLNESSNYSMLVWIPRYAYKITSNYHSSTAGNIDIVFLDKDNNDKLRK